MLWNISSLNAAAVMDDASLNRRQTIRVSAGVIVAEMSIVDFAIQIGLFAHRNGC
jgi:hypothetical protein